MIEFCLNETCDQGYSPYNILLSDTNELNKIADEIQKGKGKNPLFDYNDPNINEQNWYDFYLECNTEGVKSLYFNYGFNGDYGDEIQLSEQDKKNAFEAVLKFFGGIVGYKNYIHTYGGAA